jgi:putative transposase
MPDSLALLFCLQPCISATTTRQLSRIILGMLTMTGRVTMLGISRWTGDGASYRTIQRFFATALPWAQLFWRFFRQHLFQHDDVYLLAGDEVVVTKAGKSTHGLGRFFSSIYQRAVPGLAFFSLALISTKDRRAYPVRIEQVVRTAAEQAATKAKTTAKATKELTPKRKPGRPKGSKNKPKAAAPLSPELLRIQTLVQELLQLIAGLFPLTYLLLDGHFGNAPSLQMARQCNLHLISKLRFDAALFLPYDGPYQGRGPRRKYGANLDPQHLPEEFLQQSNVEGAVETWIYQAEVLHKEFAQALNVVIIEQVNRSTHKRAHVLLFSSDLTLRYEKLIEYYSLRFQIEFTFRDAKQYWGLEDFMTVTATGVNNAANLSLFLVNVSSVLLARVRQDDPQCSVLDLKAWYRGSKYVTALIELLPEKPDDDLMAEVFRQMTQLGRVHPPQPRLNAA